ncbi:MAG: hypothetical protein OXG83_01365 [Acidobacteria bacterium]|nr:hypothetical protein [Acidobacteriota bacterium]
MLESPETRSAPPEEPLSIQELADAVAAERQADVILYNGPIQRHTDGQLIATCASRQRHPNVLFILVTMGGDADAAYRIARCLQESYANYVLYVSGYCKSAGTLCAIGANQLVISDHGELGPLDVQMFKKDELWETQSGLTVLDSLLALQDNAFSAFEKFFLNTKARSGGSVTLRTATKIATEMATGLFAPLYGQLDPLHIGEAARAMSIAGHYGRRLLSKGRNIPDDALDFLMSQYPSHGFVIDREEARSLFSQVAAPSAAERALADALGDIALWPRNPVSGEPHSPFHFLSAEPPPPAPHEEAEVTGEADEGPHRDEAPQPQEAPGPEGRQFEDGHGHEEPHSTDETGAHLRSTTAPS